MNEQPTLQNIVEQVERLLAAVKGELGNELRRQRQSRANNNEPQRER
jgi:hypothetical protein